MKLQSNIQLAYCTNVHRGNTWEETFHSLKDQVLQVRNRVSPETRYAIGLRLGASAAHALFNQNELLNFQRWLEKNNCYIFTINGFPYGDFHGTRVKEQVYRPDWTTNERLDYTILLFKILESLLQNGEEGSVSSLPGSFKEFIPANSIPSIMFENLIECSRQIERIGRAKNLDLHLGLEPEPLGLFETTPETIQFFQSMSGLVQHKDSLLKTVGVNYDCCHLAIQGESAHAGLDSLKESGIRISKIHLSSALRIRPTNENLKKLHEFIEEVYLHQVVISESGQVVAKIKDLDLALEYAKMKDFKVGDDWRIHFHVPLHASPGNGMMDTREHVLATLDWLSENSDLCKHLEMETYTWEVLPPALRSSQVVEQIVKEYQWTLHALSERGFERE